MQLKRKIIDSLNARWMQVALFATLLLPLIIGVALYLKAYPILQTNSLRDLIFSPIWSPDKQSFGFGIFIHSSLYVTFIAFILSAPLCLLAAIYLTQFASRFLIKIVHPVIDILAGIPSVIYGMWGILVVVPFVGNNIAPIFGYKSSGYSILSGGIVLAIMCIPYMLNMLIETFNAVPNGLKEASLSLGATKWESIKHVILKKGRVGILSSFGLGVSKAFGETLAVMMVVGNMIRLTHNPLDAGYPLPALIANNYGELVSIPMYDSALMFAALVLLVVIMIINLGFRYFIYKAQKR